MPPGLVPNSCQTNIARRTNLSRKGFNTDRNKIRKRGCDWTTEIAKNVAKIRQTVEETGGGWGRLVTMWQHISLLVVRERGGDGENEELFSRLHKKNIARQREHRGETSASSGDTILRNQYPKADQKRFP